MRHELSNLDANRNSVENVTSASNANYAIIRFVIKQCNIIQIIVTEEISSSDIATASISAGDYALRSNISRIRITEDEGGG